jgi:hypothetical protein
MKFTKWNRKARSDVDAVTRQDRAGQGHSHLGSCTRWSSPMGALKVTPNRAGQPPKIEESKDLSNSVYSVVEWL